MPGTTLPISNQTPEPSHGGQDHPYPDSILPCGYFNDYFIEKLIVSDEDGSQPLAGRIYSSYWNELIHDGFRDLSNEEAFFIDQNKQDYSFMDVCQMRTRSGYHLFAVMEKPSANFIEVPLAIEPEGLLYGIIHSPFAESISNAYVLMKHLDWQTTFNLFQGFYPTALSRDYKVVDSMDVDFDGKFEANEEVDKDGDSELSNSEIIDFFLRNWNVLAEKAPFFSFGITNPIHRIIANEQETLHLTDEQVSEVYSKLREVLNNVRLAEAKRAAYNILISPWEILGDVLSPGFSSSLLPFKSIELSKVSIMRSVREAMISSGISNVPRSSDSFVRSILDGQFDCDSGSYVLLAIAHELGWPVRTVLFPGNEESNYTNHMFTRWINEDGSYVNYDIDDDSSIHDFKYLAVADYEALSAGLYFHNMTDSEIYALDYYVIADLSDNEIEALNSALAYDPYLTLALRDRARLEFLNDDLGGALWDYMALLSINPNDSDGTRGILMLSHRLLEVGWSVLEGLFNW